MSWYGSAHANNPLSASATHHQGNFPVTRVSTGQSINHGKYAIAPQPLVIYDPPDYVVINNKGGFAFAYNLTGSIGDSLTKAAHQQMFVTASLITDDMGPVRLDISPNAWTGVGEAAIDEVIGDVTFVYRGGPR